MQIIINPGCENPEELKQKIKDNNGYCLCAIEKSDDTKCMCKEFREKEDEGPCECGLYRKVDKNELKELSVKLSQVRSFMNKLAGKDGNIDIPFSLMCCLYPDAWKKIENALVQEYIKGYNECKEELSHGITTNK